jgi:deoxyuridine 5'-triphosphate nucleotidohydrolase
MLRVKKLRIKKLDPRAKLPVKKDGDAAYDLYSLDEVVIEGGSQELVHTGIACDFPPGHVGRLCDRSGVAVNKGLHVVAGVIDQSYRGEWLIAFYNMTKFSIVIPAGERVAQVLFYKVESWPVQEVTELDDTARGSGRLGSTGSK